MPSQILHGDIPQEQREVVFKAFNEGKINCLIATDVAARGLDFPNIDLILQFNPPQTSDSYVHRSGRTGRAGASGKCITFFNKQEEQELNIIEKQINVKMGIARSPSPQDVIEASIQGTIQNFQDVNSEVLANYEPISKMILEKFDQVDALSRALAIIGGNDKGFMQKSLITNQKGYMTYKVDGEIPMHLDGLFPFFKVFNNSFDREEMKEFKNIRRLEDNTGFVFDILETDKERFLEKVGDYSTRNHFIEECKSLPKIITFIPNNRNQERMEENRGGYQNRNRGGYQDRFREGYQDRNRGGYQDRNRGGYNDENRGGYQNKRQRTFTDFGSDSDSDSNDYFKAWGNDARGLGRNIGLSGWSRATLGMNRTGYHGIKSMTNHRMYPKKMALGIYGMIGLYWFFRN